jgi:Cys-tRNA(Pro) deacylase
LIQSPPDRVAAFIALHPLDAEIVPTPEGVPTVESAAAALGVEPEQIIKTLVFTGPQHHLVIAIASGTARVDRIKLAAAAGLTSVRFASPELVLSSTGYPAGGVAPIGLPDGVPVIIDDGVLTRDEVYGGAGNELHMMRVRTADLVTLNQAIVTSIIQENDA